LIPLFALLASLVLFGAFVALAGQKPLDVYYEMYRGAFGTWFSFQNTLQRASPLLLTALCTALPARAGLVVIGGEGAFVMGGLAAAATGVALSGSPRGVILGAMFAAGALVGAFWIGLCGFLRARRGVNETIASLLLTYIGIALLNHFVEGPLRDPESLNKPSTRHIGEANMLGSIPGLDVHWGLVAGVVACIAAYILMERTVFGFSAALVGGNARAARLSGVKVAEVIVITCALAGAAAGIAGSFEVAAVHGRANASLVAGYGYAGILVSFLARHNALAIIPVSLFLGGIAASGGLLQRVFALPDATVNVLQGILFVVLIASDTLYGRIRWRSLARQS
jgi:simple sugar transport system permease protein